MRESTQDRRPGRSNHAEGLIPVIDEVLRRAETDFSSLSLMGVALGPGSFTGLRIGISTAKGLVYGSDTPVVGVPTLEATAYRVPMGDGTTFICPMIDARKGEVYGALYRRTATAFECLIEDSLSAPEPLARQVFSMATSPCVFVGTGAQAYAEVIAGCTGGRGRVAVGADFPSTALRCCPYCRGAVPCRAGDEGRVPDPSLHTPAGCRGQGWARFGVAVAH